MTFAILRQHPASTILALIMTLGATALHADIRGDDAGWQLKKDKDGVQIYIRDEPGSDFEAFKAEITLNAPLQQVMAVMANPNSCVEWVHGCTVSYGFDEASFNHRYAYSVNNLPWPVKDRDYVLEINTRRDVTDGSIIMDMNTVADRKPLNDEYTRVIHSKTVYRFTPTNDGKTRMLWIQHTEPNGMLPSWLVNALAIDIPFNSLIQLQEVAQWEKYQGFTIVYDESGQIVGVNRE